MNEEKCLVFPFEKIKQNSKIVLYGAGDVGQAFYWQIKRCNYCKLVGWLDKCWSFDQNLEYPRIKIENLKKIEYDYIVIASCDEKVVESIKQTLAQNEISQDKIIYSDDYIIKYRLYQYGNIITDRTICKSSIKVVESNKEKLKIGLLTTGFIAEIIADAIKKRITSAELYGVSSRDFYKAQKFAEKHGVEKAFGSYLELVQDPLVDLVYISSPASLHYEHVRMCLENNKHVLCEKPFMLNVEQAKEVIEIARERKLFLLDGLWPWYLPMAKKITEIIKSGIIGNVKVVNANQHYPTPKTARARDINLGGGALMESGVYLIGFALLILGNEVEKIHGIGKLYEDGCDALTTIVLEYKDAMATLNCGGTACSDRMGGIYGDNGYILVEDANEYRNIKVFNPQGKIIDEYSLESGYQYELEECITGIRQCLSESPLRTHKDTIITMQIMDEVRRQIGLVYPVEKRLL